MKSGEKVAFCLPTSGKQTQFFHHIFSQPGKRFLEVPCTVPEPKRVVDGCFSLVYAQSRKVHDCWCIPRSTKYPVVRELAELGAAKNPK